MLWSSLAHYNRTPPSSSENHFGYFQQHENSSSDFVIKGSPGSTQELDCGAASVQGLHDVAEKSLPYLLIQCAGEAHCSLFVLLHLCLHVSPRKSQLFLCSLCLVNKTVLKDRLELCISLPLPFSAVCPAHPKHWPQPMRRAKQWALGGTHWNSGWMETGCALF